MDNEQKQVKNLFRKLINDQNSVFCSSDKITRTLLNKGRKSSYKKDKVFYKIFNHIEDKNIIYDFDKDKPKLPFYTPFVDQKKDIDRSSSLYSINGPMQFFHADLAYLQFFAKSAVDLKYALVCVAKKLIRNAVQNMNNTNSQKYELSPNTIEKKSLENDDFREIYDFHRMVKVSKSAER